VAGIVECVNSGPSQLWPKLFQNDRQRQNLRLHILVQRVEFQLKLIGHFNGPFHWHNMSYNTYDVKYIVRKCAAAEAA